jgi:Amt family ammonium transporter
MLHLDTGNTGFMLLCTALVMFMTPGLAFFYGGLVGRKNVLTIMMQSFVSVAWTTVIWYVAGYSLCFSGDFHGMIGNLDLAFLRGITPNTPSPVNDTIPATVFIAYQLMSAVITPALITGAFANRITFKAYMIFLTAWLFLVYFPFIHMVWGGGMLAQWGVLDFAGGIVVHNVAGVAALASVIYVGRRKVVEVAHDIPLVAIGMGLLWFGWFGFNAGSAFRADATAASAFLNTQASASFAGMVWLALDWMREGKPKFVGFMTGALAGLVMVTPASGFISLSVACTIGIIAGVICYFAVVLKNKMKWDDALDVWGVHGIGGFTGIILLGVFATAANNPNGVNGLIYGNFTFFGKQVTAVLFSSAWAFAFTYGMLKLIDMFTPVRVPAAVEMIGLDEALHGEQAYGEPAYGEPLSSESIAEELVGIK